MPFWPISPCTSVVLIVATVASGVFRSVARGQLRHKAFGKIPLKAASRICHVLTTKTIVPHRLNCFNTYLADNENIIKVLHENIAINKETYELP